MKFWLLVPQTQSFVCHLYVHNIWFLLPDFIFKFQLKTSQSLAEYMRSSSQNHYFSDLLLRACTISFWVSFLFALWCSLVKTNLFVHSSSFLTGSMSDKQNYKKCHFFNEFIISTRSRTKNIPHYHAAVEMTVLEVNVVSRSTKLS